MTRRAKHNVYGILAKGEAAMTRAERKAFALIQADLADPQGVELAVRRQAALMVVAIEGIQNYVRAQVASGKSLDEVSIFLQLPKFVNASARNLALLNALQPSQDGSNSELDRLKKVIDAGGNDATSS
jgi:hypothetical protein